MGNIVKKGRIFVVVIFAFLSVDSVYTESFTIRSHDNIKKAENILPLIDGEIRKNINGAKDQSLKKIYIEFLSKDLKKNELFFKLALSLEALVEEYKKTSNKTIKFLLEEAITSIRKTMLVMYKIYKFEADDAYAQEKIKNNKQVKKIIGLLSV